MPTFKRIPVTASAFIFTPPSLKDEKKPGPTCMPIEKINRISPNSRRKWSTFESTVYPKWPMKMPTKRTNVTPSDTPNILILPRYIPMKITKEYNRMVAAIDSLKGFKRSINHSMNK